MRAFCDEFRMREQLRVTYNSGMGVVQVMGVRELVMMM